MLDRLQAARARMVRHQLRGRGISDERVLEAMGRVARDRFMLPEYARHAYDDNAYPIACGQTISQPYMVALMSELLAVAPGMRVLEVGTGSGYQAAVLAELGAEVYTLERHPALAAAAADHLAQLGYNRVHCLLADGSQGYPPAAPYQRIIVTAATDACPPALWEQLAEGGLLVAPLGGQQWQTLELLRKQNGEPQALHSVPCRFVPLLPGISDRADS